MARNGYVVSPVTEREVEEGLVSSSMLGAAPRILFAGYLTKRTRNMMRWKRRWWELLDNGTLIYFASEKRMKLLGEVDISRSCYDVRLGAERCLVGFPRLVPPGSCFAFAIVKRTYYVFAPTTEEARGWTEHIAATSAALSRRHLSALSPQPLSPTPQPGFAPRQSHSLRPHSATGANTSLIRHLPPEAEAEQGDEPRGLPSFPGVQLRNPLLQERHSSVPASLHRVGSPARRNTGILPRSAWKADGILSPGEEEPTAASSVSPLSLSQTSSSYLPLLEHESHTGPLDREARSGRPTHTRHDSYTGELEVEGKLGRAPPQRMSIAVPVSHEFQRLQEREAEIRRRLALLDEVPPRPNSVDPRVPANKRTRSSSAGVLLRPPGYHFLDGLPAGLDQKPLLRSKEKLLPDSNFTPSYQHTNGSIRTTHNGMDGSGQLKQHRQDSHSPPASSSPDMKQHSPDPIQSVRDWDDSPAVPGEPLMAATDDRESHL